MEASPEFASFKKVVVFGSKGFKNESPTDNGMIKYI